MSSMTPRFDLPYLSEGNVNAEVPHNESLDLLSAISGLYIQDRDLTTPPTIIDGNVYVVATGATGAWAGQDGKLAFAINQAWVFRDNELGQVFWMTDEGGGGVYTGSYNFRNLGPRVALRRNLVQTLSGNTNVNWDTQIAIDGHFTHSTITNPERITLNETGMHEISAQITLENTTTTTPTVVAIRAYQGASLIAGAESYSVLNTGTVNMFHTLTLNTMRSLSGAYVKIMAEVISGATCRIAAGKSNYIKVSRS